MLQTNVGTPLGEITIFEQRDHIVSLKWSQNIKTKHCKNNSPLLREAVNQIEAFFAGKLWSFSLPLFPKSTHFQKDVLKQIQKIPPGKTVTYGTIATRLNTAPRAVGGACGYNPIPLIIPCHRVVGKTSLGGYSALGGIKTKAELLNFERKNYNHNDKLYL